MTDAAMGVDEGEAAARERDEIRIGKVRSQDQRGPASRIFRPSPARASASPASVCEMLSMPRIRSRPSLGGILSFEARAILTLPRFVFAETP
jgi:hypothetical protein